MKKYSTLFVFLGSSFFALGGLFFKMASWDSAAINSARCLIALVVVLIFLRIKKHKFVINKTVILAGVSMAFTNYLYASANKLTTAGNTIVLEFTMPIFVIIMNSFFNKKKPNKTEIVTCLFVMLGIILFFIDSLGTGNMFGNFVALLSGFTYACFFIFNTKKDSDPFTSLIISYIISILIGLPALFKVDFATTTKTTVLAILGLGLLQQATAQIFMSLGIKNTPPVTASLVSGIEPILNPILVAIFMNELLTPLSLVGATIVLVSIITYNVITSKKEETT